MRLRGRPCRRGLPRPNCGNLFEVAFPGWQTPQGLKAAGYTAQGLKDLWRGRKSSLAPADTSGVWRFRDLLPILARRGPHLPPRRQHSALRPHRAARATGVATLYAKHQGMNPTGLIQRHGHDRRASVAPQRDFRGSPARLREIRPRPWRHMRRAPECASSSFPKARSPGASSRSRWTTAPLTCQLRTDFDGCVKFSTNSSAQPNLPAQLRQPLSPRRPENTRHRNARATQLAGARPPHRSRRKPRQLLRPRQGICSR